jgi:isopentenyldiphosphate isomerase
METHSPNDEELLACFDESGREIEPRTRSEVHQKPYSIFHAVTDIWIIDKHGKLLCSKRADFVSGNPGKWQTFFGGHVRAGESFLETAQRELMEELGFSIDIAQLILIEEGKADEYKHFYKKFVFRSECKPEDLRFVDGEVQAARWLDFDEYQRERALRPENWCNGMNASQYKIILTKLSI